MHCIHHVEQGLKGRSTNNGEHFNVFLEVFEWHERRQSLAEDAGGYV